MFYVYHFKYLQWSRSAVVLASYVYIRILFVESVYGWIIQKYCDNLEQT